MPIFPGNEVSSAEEIKLLQGITESFRLEKESLRSSPSVNLTQPTSRAVPETQCNQTYFTGFNSVIKIRIYAFCWEHMIRHIILGHIHTRESGKTE